jgi:hypothetical protein
MSTSEAMGYTFARREHRKFRTQKRWGLGNPLRGGGLGLSSVRSPSAVSASLTISVLTVARSFGMSSD